MKKYVKPELFYEHFELSQHIADCAWELTTATVNDCIAYADENLPTFSTLFDRERACVDGEHTGYESYCYQTGMDGAYIFAS